MDKFRFQQQNSGQTQTPQYQQPNIFDIAAQAKQNPKAFEEFVKQNNPQAYQRALQIRNSVANPQQTIMQMAQQQGLNPNIMKMLNL
jgi:hypothetical protein